jgi:dihydroorotase
MDPETGLDAVRNIGIRDDRIVEISANVLKGKEVIDVSGLVVSPGFIDLHAHGQTNKANEFQSRDGVTTALELESGKQFLRQWLASRQGKALINYGASAAHGFIRVLAMEKYAKQAKEAKQIAESEGVDNPRLVQFFKIFDQANYESLNDDEMSEMFKGLEDDLEAGGLGIGVPIGYYPGATRDENFRLFKFAAEKDTVVFTHVRDINIAAIQEAIANAAVNGTSLHIVHINSISLGEIDVSLALVEAAQKRGLDITTELYPYTAAATSIDSAIFDEGWQKRLGITYGDLQWEATGERLTKESFEKYRKQGGVVIIHLMKPEWIEKGIRAPFTIIASDGMPYAPGAHPRSAGTFSKILGFYVREKKTLSLMDALRKMTIMPARRLEKISPMMLSKGRLQVGCDADITIFDPDKIIDTATFGKDLTYSKGIAHVMVNGQFVVKNGENVPNVYPGRAVVGKYRR